MDVSHGVRVWDKETYPGVFLLSISYGIFTGANTGFCSGGGDPAPRWRCTTSAQGILYPRTSTPIGGEIHRVEIPWSEVKSVFSVKGVFSWFRPVEFRPIEFCPLYGANFPFSPILTPLCDSCPIMGQKSTCPKSQVQGYAVQSSMGQGSHIATFNLSPPSYKDIHI